MGDMTFPHMQGMEQPLKMRLDPQANKVLKLFASPYREKRKML